MEKKINTEEKEVKKVSIMVTEAFLDKFDLSIRYEAGKVLEFDEERAQDVVDRKSVV